MRRILILQPYVPNYRVPFFQSLSKILAEEHTELVVAAARPRGVQALRADEANRQMSWLIDRPQRAFEFRGHTFSRTNFARGSQLDLRQFSAVIAELEGTSLDAYRLAHRRRSGPRLGLWGHVAPYVRHGNPIDLKLETYLMRSCDQVFAYVESGRQFAVRRGIPADKVTVVENSIDTSGLLAALQAELAISGGGELHSAVTSSPTLAFIGGLDSSKRIDFLASSLEVLWKLDSNIRVLIAGDGPDRGRLEAASLRGQVELCGYADTSLKASVLARSRAIVMPGRIGLVAVEALASGLPIVTVKWPFHAPEYEYLTEGESLMSSGNTPQEFAAMMRKAAISGPLGGQRQMVHPSLESMVTNFAGGISRMMEGDADAGL